MGEHYYAPSREKRGDDGLSRRAEEDVAISINLAEASLEVWHDEASLRPEMSVAAYLVLTQSCNSLR